MRVHSNPYVKRGILPGDFNYSLGGNDYVQIADCNNQWQITIGFSLALEQLFFLEFKTTV